MIKSKKIINCFLGIVLLGCSQQPQNILPSPSVLPTKNPIFNQTTVPPIPQVVVSSEPEITGIDSSGKKLLCQPIEKALENLSVKCPKSIAVTRDGKSIFFTNYTGRPSQEVKSPGDCENPPENRISFIYKISDKKLDVVKLSDNKPFYKCGYAYFELQTDKQNNLYFNIGSLISKISPKGAKVDVLNSSVNQIKGSCEGKMTELLSGCSYTSGYRNFQLIDSDIYYNFGSYYTFPEEANYSLNKTSVQNFNNSEIVKTRELWTNYTIYNGDIYLLDYITQDSNKNGVVLMKLKNNPIEKNEVKNPNISVISDLKELKNSDVETDYDLSSLNKYITCLKANSKGEIFFNDLGRNVIWKVIPKDGEQVTAVIFAGNGHKGYKDGKEKEAQFNYPHSFDFDDNDNMYVSDTGNNAIRKITPDGNVTTFYK